MTNLAIGDLTDKEKEALRLLLNGHDAKSSAIELDISVHALNDRLRSARRKLGVASSREAARILGDAEEARPQNLARKDFGMEASNNPDDKAILNQPSRAGSKWSLWLTGGMLIMSILIAAAVFTVSSSGDDSVNDAFVAQESQAETSSSSVGAGIEDAESLDRAQAFLKETDAGNWEESWNVAGEFFQKESTSEEWTSMVEPVRSPLGAVEERRLASAQKTSTLPGAPEGDYEVLQYTTKFSATDRLAIETVVMVRNGDSFDVAGYFIR
ncbi:MAG: DUF4019 domain-containing protein [Pseudomonadota bacterium]